MPAIAIVSTAALLVGCAGSTAETRTAREVAGASRSSTLTAAEQEALANGATVTRPIEGDPGGQHWVGGVAYQIVRATPHEVLAALESVDTLPELLPRTKSARVVGVDGGEAFVELVQGSDMAEATYTIRFRREGDAELKFWLDPTRPHDIDNVWAVPWGNDHTLVTVAVALDLGPGIVRMLFEDRIQQTILDTPRRIRDFVEPRAVAAF
jgi:hypothetical protein